MPQPALQHIVCTLDGARVRMAYWQWGDQQSAHVVVCVHGLTRGGRDFDVLAQTLLADAEQRDLPPLRIICPDVPGRGESDWLPDPALYQVPTYAACMLQLLAHLHQQAAIAMLDWVGTSMGGLIGLGMAAAQKTEAWPLPAPVRRWVFNDVGPAIALTALERIGGYVQDTGPFASEAEGLAFLQRRMAGFGPHTPQQWEAMNRPMLRPHPQGGWRLHYDPRIGEAFNSVSAEALAQGEALLWQIYDGMDAPLLLLRGAQSDLLTPATAQAMRQRGPQAHLVEFAGVGHAPMLIVSEQTAVVSKFLLSAAADA